jgi:hypothetical protein
MKVLPFNAQVEMSQLEVAMIASGGCRCAACSDFSDEQLGDLIKLAYLPAIGDGKEGAAAAIAMPQPLGADPTDGSGQPSATNGRRAKQQRKANYE